MAIFGPKPWVNPFEQMSIFRRFKLKVFIAQKGVFSFHNIVKDIFQAYIASKKKFEKWLVFDLNHGLTPLEKLQFFDVLNFCFYSVGRRFFVLEYPKSHFPNQYCQKKKKVGKMARFRPKPCVNPFGKTSIFRHSELLVFIAKKGVFSFQNTVKVIFLTNIAKKKDSKMIIFGPKPWVNHLG